MLSNNSKVFILFELKYIFFEMFCFRFIRLILYKINVLDLIDEVKCFEIGCDN